jgi:uncharacterized membrane protein/glutaredoxin
MNDLYNFLFKYLEKEEIQIDKTEFLFQLQSHPEFPSLLAISDTLTFFNIDTIAARVDFGKIDSLPERFIARLNNVNGDPELFLIEKRGGSFFCTKEKTIEIAESSLESRWNGIVLLVEKAENVSAIDTKKNNLFWVLPSLGITFFVATLFLYEGDWQIKSFFVFPIIGILFSIAALKDLFGAKSELINSFCNITSTTNCSTIIDSKKWKIFSFFNLSSLSIVFYATQFVALFVFLLLNNTEEYFYIQKILLFSATPVVLLSIYYQKFVEKKWCPICLVIVSVLIFELVFLVSFQENNFKVSLKSLVLFGFMFFTIAFVWALLKAILTKQKGLKEFQFTGNRFMRNYEIFKNTLLARNSVDLPTSPIVLGNKESDTEISIITSPFCGYCENAHKILEKILIANQDSLKIKVLINVDIDVLEEEKKIYLRTLMSIYLEKGDTFFLEALNYWFETKNLKDWISRYKSTFDSEQMDSIYRQQNQWCTNNGFNYTPIIFINGYQYPKAYSRENLEFFVSDLVEDDFFELA